MAIINYYSKLFKGIYYCETVVLRRWRCRESMDIFNKEKNHLRICINSIYSI